MDNFLQRDTRLDYVKALAISLVLIWHLKPIDILSTNKSAIFIKVFNFLWWQFNLQVTLVAVPLFLLVSLFLLYQKIKTHPLDYIHKRCRRIGEVFLFWTACQFAFFYGILIIQSIYNEGIDFSINTPIIKLLMNGGPNLPAVGGSVFYFLFVLFILVFVSAIIFRLRNIKKLFQLILIADIIISLLYFETLNLKGRGLSYWRVENFLIYIPLSYFIFIQECNAPQKLNRYIPLFYMGFAIFSAQDVYLRFLGYNGLGAYSRLSIVFGSIAIFCSILQLRDLTEVTLISLLSKYSLGIFATHKYWQLIVILSFKYLGFTGPFYAAGFPLEVRSLTLSLVSTLLTFMGILFASRTPIKRFLI